MFRLPLRIPVVIAAALYVVLVHAAVPASAHATLVGSDPEDGARLGSEPTTVSLTFNEDVSTPAQLQVTGPGGETLADGDPTVDGGTVSQTVATSGYAGTYTIAYRVISSDGHPITGELTYDVTTGERAEQTGAEHEEESFAERHQTHLILGAGAVVIAVALLAWPWIRRRV